MKKLAVLTAAFLAHTLLAFTAFSFETEWQKSEGDSGKARIIGSFYQEAIDAKDTTKTEKKLVLGLHFIIKDGWKIYGPDSFDVGLPPMLDFEGSKNYVANKILWPKAEEHEEVIDASTKFKYSTYEKEVIIPITINLKDYEDKTFFNIKLNYGLCKEVCIPAEAKFSFDLDPQEESLTHLALIKKYDDKNLIKDLPRVENSGSKDKDLMFFGALLAAFIGGLILNLMPCVLPVLSIKLISIVSNVDAEIRRMRLAFLATIFGILSCFLILALITILFKLGGYSLGWGLQFQNPYFLTFLILVVTFFTANLFGFFEITFDHFFSDIINKKINLVESKKHNIFTPNFLSGVLAVLLATPCSAPFLGSAISFALSQKTYDILAIFMMIGVGIAFPYFVLLIRPQLVYLLPKPGKWMISIKRMMGIFLFCTVLWLLYVLNHNVGSYLATILGFISLVIIFTFKIKNSLVRKIILIVLVLISFFTVKINAEVLDRKNLIEIKQENLWIKFDENKINQLIGQGKVVVVDVTADWCLTCKLNKKLVLDTKEFQEKLQDPNIVAMRADITKPDKTVMDFLRSHNRFAIPFNAVYGPKAPKGLLTKELLNKQELLDLIEQAK